MDSLTHALRLAGDEGEPIPCPYPGLVEAGAHIRRGQLSMIAAGPGGGKTMLMTDWCLRLPQASADAGATPHRVLFFSADSDRGTVGNRVLAAVFGRTMPEVEHDRRHNPTPEMWERLHNATRHIEYCFTPTITPDLVGEETWAYETKWGRHPEVIVVDNLADFVTTGKTGVDDHAGAADAAKILKDLAVDTGAAVILLHHLNAEGAKHHDQPVPRSGVRGQLTGPQRLILTLHTPTDGELAISVVKNSNGRARPAGGYGVIITVDPSRMAFSPHSWRWL
jgi:replicative DNA helicase